MTDTPKPPSATVAEMIDAIYPGEDGADEVVARLRAIRGRLQDAAVATSFAEYWRHSSPADLSVELVARYAYTAGQKSASARIEELECAQCGHAIRYHASDRMYAAKCVDEKHYGIDAELATLRAENERIGAENAELRKVTGPKCPKCGHWLKVEHGLPGWIGGLQVASCNRRPCQCSISSAELQQEYPDIAQALGLTYEPGAKP